MTAFEDPEVRPAGRPTHETEATHPAYAHAGAYRVQGLATLHGSDLRHREYVLLRISRSRLDRSGAREHHQPSRVPLVEVAMSVGQWSTLISAVNGGGTPCTLRSLNGEPVPGLPPPPDRRGRFGADAAARLERAGRLLEEAERALEASGLSGARRAPIADGLRAARAEIGSNLEYVAEQFAEHMEDVVERAKAEIHGFVADAAARAGADGARAPLLAGPDFRTGEG